MAGHERARLRAGAALLFVVLLTLLAAGTAFAGANRIGAAPDQAGSVPPMLEPGSARGLVHQGYDLLMDNFVTRPSPADLLGGAAQGVVRRVSEGAPGEWPSPALADAADREQTWQRFDGWLNQVVALAGPRVARDAIEEAALRGMIAFLDEHHTRYMTPEQYQEHLAWRRDDVRYAGIGARMRGASAVVLEIFPGSPAEGAGLRPGDHLVEVDGQPTAGQTSENVIGRVRGPLGSTVSLLVERRGLDAPFGLSVQRAEIKLESVRWSVMQRPDGRKYGYLQVRGFPDPSVDDRIGEGLAELDRAGIDGLVLDLRGNGGGRIDVGLKVASRFIKDDAVYQQLDRDGRLRVVRTIGGYWSRLVPIVALVDGGTASMGEITAAALQEAGVARIVGTQTSGSVAGARIFALDNGGALQVTVISIVSGHGAALNDVGVTPDQVIEFGDDALLSGVDVQLQSGLEQLDVTSNIRRSALLPLLIPTGKAA